MRLSLLLVLTITACTDGGDDLDTETGSDTETDTETVDAAEVYAFDARDGSGSSVVYTGQVFRHLLISGMTQEVGALTASIDAGSVFPETGDVIRDLNFYMEFDGSVGGIVPVPFAAELPPLQATYADVASGSSLVGKIAGNDATGQHVDWSTAFVGWDQEGVTTPESLVRAWISELDALAVARAGGDIPEWPDGTPMPSVFLTEDGLDLQQLMQKFLLGAIAFSQGADDYLDDDLDGKGLLSDNTVLVEGKSYTALEHAWDEGFGYFGATRTFGSMSDDEIADVGFRDDNEDGSIDLTSERVFGHAANAAKRDRGSVVMTDYTAQAWDAFLSGRILIDSADGALTEAELTELRGYRDDAVDAWERAIAATAVHYINDVLQDLNALDDADYSPASHAKHWAELKGFSLSLQFNPNSAVSDADFVELQDLIGMAPVLQAAGRDQAVTDLIAARSLLESSYGFASENMGDSNGENGW